ncbi:MAG: hypothetical protein AABX03_03365 [Nanoarchaeota archaeon]
MSKKIDIFLINRKFSLVRSFYIVKIFLVVGVSIAFINWFMSLFWEPLFYNPVWLRCKTFDNVDLFVKCLDTGISKFSDFAIKIDVIAGITNKILLWFLVAFLCYVFFFPKRKKVS